MYICIYTNIYMHMYIYIYTDYDDNDVYTNVLTCTFGNA